MAYHIVGYPRMGPKRELKFALESFWGYSWTGGGIDTNYHFSVPELGPQTKFSYASHKAVSEYKEAKAVIVADNFFTGSKDNLKKWIGHPRFELIRHDVTEPLLVEVDQIYHLACPALPIFYKHNPVKTIKTNVIGTLNMLGLAKRVGARILLTSTSEVYGDPLEPAAPPAAPASPEFLGINLRDVTGYEGPSMMDGIEPEGNISDDGMDAWNAEVAEVELAAERVISGVGFDMWFFAPAGGAHLAATVPLWPSFLHFLAWMACKMATRSLLFSDQVQGMVSAVVACPRFLDQLGLLLDSVYWAVYDQILHLRPILTGPWANLMFIFDVPRHLLLEDTPSPASPEAETELAGSTAAVDSMVARTLLVELEAVADADTEPITPLGEVVAARARLPLRQ